MSDEKKALAHAYFIEDVVHTGHTKLPQDSVTAYAEILEVSEEVIQRIEILISEGDIQEVECKFPLSAIFVCINSIT
jgi:hypothetical protein